MKNEVGYSAEDPKSPRTNSTTVLLCRVKYITSYFLFKNLGIVMSCEILNLHVFNYLHAPHFCKPLRSFNFFFLPFFRYFLPP